LTLLPFNVRVMVELSVNDVAVEIFDIDLHGGARVLPAVVLVGCWAK